MEEAARWLREIPKTGFLPVGRKAMVRGELDGDFMVDIGVDTYLQMSLAEVENYLKTKLTETMTMEQPIGTGIEKGRVVKLPTEETEIIEELSAEDLEFMNRRSKPRVAHTLQFPSTSKVHFVESYEGEAVDEDLRRLAIGPNSRAVEEDLERLKIGSNSQAVEEDLRRLELGPNSRAVKEDLRRLELGPVKSRVVERASPSSATDPAQTVIQAHVKESLFKRRTEFWRNNQGE